MSRFGQKGSASRTKSLTYSKLSKKTENLSKMVPAALFVTICSQYQTVPDKGTYLLGFDKPCTRGTVHMSRFGQKGSDSRTKSLTYSKLSKKIENLSKMVRVHSL